MKSKYVKIYDDILNKIENNIYKFGDSLPSEADLMKEYEASRDTIRKSLNMLVTNGYIEKKGKGKVEYIYATDKGISIIENLKNINITSVDLVEINDDIYVLVKEIIQ